MGTYDFYVDGLDSFLNIETGDVVTLREFDRDEEDEELNEVVEEGFNEVYFRIPQRESDEGYTDMIDFAETVADEKLRSTLISVLSGGKKIFRRFKDALGADSDPNRSCGLNEFGCRIGFNAAFGFWGTTKSRKVKGNLSAAALSQAYETGIRETAHFRRRCRDIRFILAACCCSRRKRSWGPVGILAENVRTELHPKADQGCARRLVAC
ncbi:hypothetical protein ACFFNY_11365 [Paenibacillus hodogayensis]|uniref:Uncharacterized protein n=1 Tax=Paenibacillus hodogayensis TaxID=279208 RepID=A0ABV5VV08_9BACL